MVSMLNEIFGFITDYSPDFSPYVQSEGIDYIRDKYLEASKGLPATFNAQAIPEYRALEKAKWFKLSVEEAKKLIEEEHYWQKEENRDRYPGFKWF